MLQFIVDAFTEKIFCGNPAAVCIVEKFPEEKIMLKIAQENNLSETAFAVKEKNLNSVEFETMRGNFSVTKDNNFFEMNFPAYDYKKIPVTAEMSEAIGEKVLEAYLSRDLLMILENEEKIKNLRPDFEKLKKLDGLIQAVTAKSSEKNFDCVSRVFAPKIKILEDPVTGSTHCLIAPIWAKKTGKNILKCYQASERGGELICEIFDERVKISGKAVLFAESKLNIEE